MTTLDQHEPDCQRPDDCVECGGCDCGLNQRTCDPKGPGCYSYDALDQWEQDTGQQAVAW